MNERKLLLRIRNLEDKIKTLIRIIETQKENVRLEKVSLMQSIEDAEDDKHQKEWLNKKHDEREKESYRGYG